MKLPSLRLALQDVRHTLSRFPLVLLDAALGTFSAIILVEHEDAPQPTVFFKLLFAAILGLPLLTALVLTAEKRGWSRGMSWLVQGIGVLFLIAYATTVPANLTVAPAAEIIRLLLLAFAMHLLVAAAPFLVKNEVNGFWHFNQTLFLRFLTSALFTLVLYAGLALALAAINNLFGMNIEGKRYAQLWMFLAGLFCTWFFLAGVPANLQELESRTEYPKGLRVFTNYVLLPLLLIYLAILCAYLAKILFSWEWPEGWVSKLILGFACTGLFAILLAHPMLPHAEKKWIRRAPEWFFLVMIPLVVMLFLAIWRRVSEYGWTEGRFLAVGVGVWLVLMILYFLLSKKRDIKVIPATLCVAALLLSYGPWSPLAVSERSQVNRLQKLLVDKGLLVNGLIQKASAKLPFKEVREVSAILTYLHEIHGFEKLQPWFSVPLRADSVSDGAYKNPEYLAGLMGLEYVRVRPGPEGGFVMFEIDRRAALDIEGFNRLVADQMINARQTLSKAREGGLSYQASGNLAALTLRLATPDGGMDTATFNLREAVDKLLVEYQNANTSKIPADRMMISSIAGGLKAKVCLRQVNVRQEKDSTRILWYEADFLYMSGN